jgi:hypothetical protein
VRFSLNELVVTQVKPDMLIRAKAVTVKPLAQLNKLATNTTSGN